jgi:hypothetical protein
MNRKHAAAALLAVAALGLAGCNTAQQAVPEANLTGSPISVSDDMTALCQQFIEQALPVEAAQALAETSGYSSRVGSIDGQPQALTKDYREDRFTFDVENGIVTGCTIG